MFDSGGGMLLLKRGTYQLCQALQIIPSRRSEVMPVFHRAQEHQHARRIDTIERGNVEALRPVLAQRTAKAIGQVIHCQGDPVADGVKDGAAVCLLDPEIRGRHRTSATPILNRVMRRS